MRVFASAEILSVHSGSTGSTTMLKSAHRAVFGYTPKEGMIYVRSRAISSRCNDNFDQFPADEIGKAYRSFIGKPVFVNHHNDDHKRMRGLVIDAALHHDRNPDGSPDTWAEVLMEIDGQRFPRLAQALVNGWIDRTSMGCDVQLSKCSICHNEARTPLEYCQHIPGKKGQRLIVTAADGRKEARLVFEECRGLSFFENSVLVEPPADPTAFFLGNVELGPGLDHLHGAKAVRAMQLDKPAAEESVEMVRTASRALRAVPELPILSRTARREAPQVTNALPRFQAASREIWGMLHEAVREEQAKALLPVEAVKAKKPVAEMSDEEYSAHQTAVAKGKKEGEAWNRKNPVKIKNIVEHWHAASEDEKANGENWYSDAHHLARHIANDTGTPMHTMAGLMSNYSPQTHWSTNIMNAARVARTKTGMGGKGEGIMATANQKRAANRMLSGEHYDNVLAGPKTRAFAHLIEHGKNADPEDPKVVIDRHALSVAAGARATDNAYMHSKLGTKGRYNEVSQAYHKAAKQISKHEGRPIEAHQVQAATWLVRQRLNEEHDRNLSQTAGSRSATIAQGAVKEWNSYAAEHHPGAIGKEPGTGYSQTEPEDVKHAAQMENEGMHNTKVARRY